MPLRLEKRHKRIGLGTFPRTTTADHQRDAAHYSSVPLSNKTYAALADTVKIRQDVTLAAAAWEKKTRPDRRRQGAHTVSITIDREISDFLSSTFYLCAQLRPARSLPTATRVTLDAPRCPAHAVSNCTGTKAWKCRGKPSVVLSSSMTLSSSPRLLEDYHPKLPAPPRLDRPPIFVLSVGRRQNRQPAQN